MIGKSCDVQWVGLTSPCLNFVLLQLIDLNLTQTDILQLIEELVSTSGGGKESLI